MNDTAKDAIITAQAQRIATLRAALEEGARNAMAGNGVDQLKQAVCDDDRSAEQLERIINDNQG